jgi:hypothetical protein
MGQQPAVGFGVGGYVQERFDPALKVNMGCGVSVVLKLTVSRGCAGCVNCALSQHYHPWLEVREG